MHGQEERRAVKRYFVSAPAQFRWQSVTGAWLSSAGVAQDVSVAGIYISCQRTPEVGAAVEVKLPVNMFGDGASKAYLVGKGLVNRSESGVGFAAELVLRLFRSDQPELSGRW